MNASRPLAWLATLAVLVAVAWAAHCTSDSPTCEPGSQIQCRCGDGTYGYRQCDSLGHYDGGCACVIGLTPDAGVPPDAGMP